jgi:DNA-binding MarR family transcriptional regulator
MKLREWGEFEKRFGIPPTECKFTTEQTVFLVYLWKREQTSDITEEQVKDLDITQEDIKRATERFFGVIVPKVQEV